MRLVADLESLGDRLYQEVPKPQLASREDTDGSRRKRAFVLLLGDLFKHFKKPTRKWLPGDIQESIRVLTEIAFDIEIQNVQQIDAILKKR